MKLHLNDVELRKRPKNVSSLILNSSELVESAVANKMEMLLLGLFADDIFSVKLI